jgi:hypothetical protein
MPASCSSLLFTFRPHFVHITSAFCPHFDLVLSAFCRLIADRSSIIWPHLTALDRIWSHLVAFDRIWNSSAFLSLGDRK